MLAKKQCICFRFFAYYSFRLLHKREKNSIEYKNILFHIKLIRLWIKMQFHEVKLSTKIEWDLIVEWDRENENETNWKIIAKRSKKG